MSQKEVIKKELMEISPLLAAMSRHEVYSLPENSATPSAFGIILLAEKKEPALQIPGDYFENLPSLLQQRIHSNNNDTEELKVDLTSTNPYHLEQDYFVTLSDKINQKKKVIQLKPFRKQRFFWSAAACIVGLLGLMMIYFSQHGTTSTPQTVPITADVNHQQVDEALNNIDGSSMVEYLNEQGQYTDNEWLAMSDETPSISDAADILSEDDEVRQYVDQVQQQHSDKSSLYELF